MDGVIYRTHTRRYVVVVEIVVSTHNGLPTGGMLQAKPGRFRGEGTRESQPSGGSSAAKEKGVRDAVGYACRRPVADAGGGLAKSPLVQSELSQPSLVVLSRRAFSGPLRAAAQGDQDRMPLGVGEVRGNRGRQRQSTRVLGGVVGRQEYLR